MNENRDENQGAPTGVSYWLDTFSPRQRPPLSNDLQVDVCVIGAGIAGLTTAYFLARAGKSVAVLEDGLIGSGMTGYTTAHLTNALDDRYYELERYHGQAGARLAADSHTAAIRAVEDIVHAEGIDCDFRRVDGYLFRPPGDPVDNLNKELAAVHRAGLIEVAAVAGAPFEGMDSGAALRFPNQGQFHPLKYLEGLAQAIERLNGRIFCRTHATSAAGGRPARVETNVGHAVTAEDLVIATNVPINDRLVIHTKQAPYTTYVVGLEVSAMAPAGSGEALTSARPALYWDTRQSAGDEASGKAPYHYARLARGDGGDDILIVGGEDHKSGQAEKDSEEIFRNLVAWTRERWPMAGAVRYRWSGQVMEPADGLAFIGRNPMDHENVFVATGDSGNGITHGTIAGMLLSDLILGRANPWRELYDPGRIKLQTAGDFIRENANVAKELVAGLIKPAEVRHESDIPANEGALLRRGVKRIAAFRDAGGQLHEMSATCPHLGCTVAWNTVEKTWDCPCHGSRFDCMGHVVNGPANVDLEPLAEPAKA